MKNPIENPIDISKKVKNPIENPLNWKSAHCPSLIASREVAQAGSKEERLAEEGGENLFLAC